MRSVDRGPWTVDRGALPLVHAARRSSVHGSRSAFTLVELLVGLTIILILAAIGVMFVPSVQNGDKATTGARQVLGMLQIAKTRAMRDQAPRGVRLFTSANNPLVVTDLKYIEQPADYYDPKSAGPQPLLTPPTPGGTTTVTFSNPGIAVPPPDFWGGFGPSDPTRWPVQPGDYVEFNSGGVLRKILAVPGLTTSSQLVLGVVNTTGALEGGPGSLTIKVTITDFPTIPPDVAPNLNRFIASGMTLTLGSGTTQETAMVTAVGVNAVTVRSCLQAPKTMFRIQNDPPLNIAANCPYRIVRQPRVIAGEDGLTLPVDVAIQLGAADMHKGINPPGLSVYDPPSGPGSPDPRAINPPNPPGTVFWYDVMFSPSGALVGTSAANDKVILWVRDVTQTKIDGNTGQTVPDVDANSPLLACVYTRSGQLAAHPVDMTPGGNPYTFTIDGKSSGE